MAGLKWAIGKIDIFQVIEMEENEIFNSFIPEATPENIKKIDWLKPHFADEKGKLKALVQSFLVKSRYPSLLRMYLPLSWDVINLDKNDWSFR